MKCSYGVRDFLIFTEARAKQRDKYEGPLCRVFLSFLSFSPSTHFLLTVHLTFFSSPQIPTPCTTSPPALLARSVVLRRRLPAPFSLAALTRKLSFPTRAARASSKASTCLQTLSVLRLDQKVRFLLLALWLFSVGLLTCRV